VSSNSPANHWRQLDAQVHCLLTTGVRQIRGDSGLIAMFKIGLGLAMAHGIQSTTSPIIDDRVLDTGGQKPHRLLISLYLLIIDNFLLPMTEPDNVACHPGKLIRGFV
jgi:hypothetical protein